MNDLSCRAELLLSLSSRSITSVCDVRRVGIPKFFAVKLSIAVCPDMRLAVSMSFNDGTISRQGVSPAARDLSLGTMLRSSCTSQLSHSDLVLWNKCDVPRRGGELPVMKMEQTFMP